MWNDSYKVFFSLLKRDLYIFRKQVFGKFIDAIFLVCTNIVIFSYFMPEMGMSTQYGPFLLVGAIGSFGFFNSIGKVTGMISDISGERMISYTMTLPLTSRAVLVYIATYWAINSALVSLMLFPIGKIILFTRFDLSKISFSSLLIIYPTVQLFFGFFSLWLVAVIKQLSAVSRIWIRVINPIFMFGSFFYTWQASYKLSPIIAYLSLANPMVYVMEGMRNACLGSEGYLPLSLCVSALWVFIIFCGMDAIRRLSKRLDCV